MKLGDAVAEVIQAVGVRSSKDCGCRKRQEQLNVLGEKVAESARRIFSTAPPVPTGPKVGEWHSLNLSAEIVGGEVPGMRLNGFMLEGVPTKAGEFVLRLRNVVEFQRTIKVAE